MKAYCVLLSILLWVETNAIEPIAETPLGKIRGTYLRAMNDRLITAFRGIPYAKAPIGELRFQPPEKITEPWVDTLDATKDGPDCMQCKPDTKEVIGKEDCLVVNVYVPEALTPANLDVKKAVLVHIHGGAFTSGSGSSVNYGPKRMLEHDIILVTLNYRLHMLGFLQAGFTTSSELPGNVGLLDQAEALTWVQENIAAFGGDPEHVTLMGEGAGGASVSFHLLSKFSSDLFSAAIIMSGNPLSQWYYDHEPVNQFKELATIVGCDKPKLSASVDCVKGVPIEKLIETLPGFVTNYFAPFRPARDGFFLTDHPSELYKKGRIGNQVPVMMGTSKLDGIFYYGFKFGNVSPSYSQELIANVTKFVLNIKDEAKLEEAVSDIAGRYFQVNSLPQPGLFHQRIIKVLSDSLMVPHYFVAHLYSKFGLNPYVYTNEYITDHSTAKLFKLEDLDITAPTHGDELFYLFDNKYYFPSHYRIPNDENEAKFLKLFVNFAKVRNPTPPTQKRENWRPWYASKSGNIRLYHLDKPMSSSRLEINAGLTSFWMQKLPTTLGYDAYI